MHLHFSLLLSHFQPIFVSFVAVSGVLSCTLFFQGLVGIVPWQDLNDLWMPIIWVVWVMSYDWWMVSYTTSTKACPPKYSQKLLKACCIRILTSDVALKQGQKTRLNGDKPHTVLKTGYSKCQQGQGLLLWI